jgi:hypothetical protein
MNRLLIGGAAAALVVAIAPVDAQPAPPPPPGVASGTAPALVAPTVPRVRTMAMTGRTMARDEVSAHVRSMFARLDINRDGFVTRDEMEAIHQKMIGMRGEMQKRFGGHEMPRADRSAMFDRLDTNHDGSISRQEYILAQPQVREKRLMVMEHAPAPGARMPGMPDMPHMHGMMTHRAGMGGHLFEMADANRDGRVSLAEAESAALAHFDRADLNHDGKITPDERSQAHQLMRQRRPS